MPDSSIPWVGLAALAAMFVLPLLPNWLFEGPRTSKHWPRRHICGDCGAPGPTTTPAPLGRACPGRRYGASCAASTHRPSWSTVPSPRSLGRR